MLNKILISILLLATPLVFAAAAYASVDPLDPICGRYSANDPNAPAVCREDAATRTDTITNNRVVSTLARVVEVLMFGIGIASVIAIIVGGILYAISAGDPQKALKARNTIIYALAGLVIAVLSQLIINFVLARI